MLEHFADWDESLRALIADADADADGPPGAPRDPRPARRAPLGSRPPRHSAGDAAHLMSPFAGVGANLAMLDGAELGAALAAHPGDTEAALSAYGRALFPRGEASAILSARGLGLCFRGDDPRGLLDLFTIS